MTHTPTGTHPADSGETGSPVLGGGRDSAWRQPSAAPLGAGVEPHESCKWQIPRSYSMGSGDGAGRYSGAAPDHKRVGPLPRLSSAGRGSWLAQSVDSWKLGGGGTEEKTWLLDGRRLVGVGRWEAQAPPRDGAQLPAQTCLAGAAPRRGPDSGDGAGAPHMGSTRGTETESRGCRARLLPSPGAWGHLAPCTATGLGAGSPGRLGPRHG